MAYLAMVTFVALLAFGRQFFGWSDPAGHVQIALVCAFVSGAVCGFKSRD